MKYVKGLLISASVAFAISSLVGILARCDIVSTGDPVGGVRHVVAVPFRALQGVIGTPLFWQGDGHRGFPNILDYVIYLTFCSVVIYAGCAAFLGIKRKMDHVLSVATIRTFTGIIAAAIVGVVIYFAHLMILDNRQFALSRAAGEGDIATVRSCIEEGVMIDAQPGAPDSVHGSTALYRATSGGHEDIVRFLLDHGANPNLLYQYENPLITACAARNYSIARLLLEHGANPNVNVHPDTALAVACRNSDYSLAKLLLDYGADPNLRGYTGSPLENVIGQPELAKLLREHGAHDIVPP